MNNTTEEVAILVVVILKARNLAFPNRVPLKTYAKARMVHGQTAQTRSVQGGPHPEWNDEFHLKVLARRSRMPDGFVRVEEPKLIIDVHGGDAGVLLGSVSLPITGNWRHNQFDEWVNISLNGVLSGQIYLEMTYYPNLALKHGQHKPRRSADPRIATGYTPGTPARRQNFVSPQFAQHPAPHALRRAPMFPSRTPSPAPPLPGGFPSAPKSHREDLAASMGLAPEFLPRIDGSSASDLLGHNAMPSYPVVPGTPTHGHKPDRSSNPYSATGGEIPFQRPVDSPRIMSPRHPQSPFFSPAQTRAQSPMPAAPMPHGHSSGFYQSPRSPYMYPQPYQGPSYPVPSLHPTRAPYEEPIVPGHPQHQPYNNPMYNNSMYSDQDWHIPRREPLPISYGSPQPTEQYQYPYPQAQAPVDPAAFHGSVPETTQYAQGDYVRGINHDVAFAPSFEPEQQDSHDFIAQAMLAESSHHEADPLPTEAPTSHTSEPELHPFQDLAENPNWSQDMYNRQLQYEERLRQEKADAEYAARLAAESGETRSSIDAQQRERELLERFERERADEELARQLAAEN